MTFGIEAEELHYKHLLDLKQSSDSEQVKALLLARQQDARKAAERLAKFAPKGSLQLVPAVGEKGAAAKKAQCRCDILENEGKELTIQMDSSMKNLLCPSLIKVPIKLDIEVDGYKLRDSLLWNLTDGTVGLEDFAIITCEDFELPQGTMVPAIVKSIQEQIAEYQEYLGLLRMVGGLKEFRGIRGLIRVIILII